MHAQLIDEATQEIFGHVNKQLTENQLKAVVPDAHSIDLVISSQCVHFSYTNNNNNDIDIKSSVVP